ncbi:MAG TPA: ADOP family duplicated permease [Gemmatimonadaceae bacterium]
MKLPNGVRRLFRLPLSRARMLRDADEELQFHLAMRVAEFRALGMSETEAAMEAQRKFGDADEFRAYAVVRADRRSRRFAVLQWLEDFGQDVRIALRQFRQGPGLAVVVVLTLAICIGATTAVYGVVRHLLLSPLPYRDGNRIVNLELRNSGDGEFGWGISASLYRLWAARSRTLEDFAAFDWGTYAIESDGRATPDSVGGGRVTPSFLSLLRVRPSLGRGFAASDASYGAPPVVLIGDSLWRSRFAASPEVIGRSMSVDGLRRMIVGVLPPNVGDPSGNSAGFVPAIELPLNIDSATGVDAFARLRSGVTSAAGSRELQGILDMLPDTGLLYGRRASARTTAERVEPGRRRAVEVLFIAAGALLLIACADVAGLLLMRGWSRRREFAVRQALGAERGRLARQLLTESLLLAIPGGALGVIIAWLGLRAIRAVGFWYLEGAHLNAAVLVWTIAVSVATSLLFGAGPALLAWERSPDDALRAGGARIGHGRSTGRAHAILVIAQIALSLVFLATADVLIRSFVALVRAPIGFEPHGLFEVAVRRNSLTTKFTVAQEMAAMQAIRDAIASMPGISEVAIGALPLTRTVPGPSEVEGASGVRPSGVMATGGWRVGSDYFQVARIALVRGRGFDVSPTAASSEVIINQRLARRLWPDRDALGARMRYGENANARWLTVVGIVGDVRMPGDVGPDFFGLQVYRSPALISEGEGAVLVRTRLDSAELGTLLARAIERAGVDVRISRIMRGTTALEYAYRAPRFALLIYGVFTLLAVVLAAVGLFGIIEHAVARRTREIAIRVALGADPAVLTRTILRQSLRLLVVGCGVGLATAYAAGRGLTTFLYGVQPLDPVALGIAITVLTAIALGASALPVRHALRVDPMETLRSE